jgi:glucose/arabinose dehydrogenase
MLGIGIIVFLISAARTNQALPIEKIKVPPGFSLSVFATGVNNAREMALGSNGTLFVGSREAGNVYAVVSRDPETRAAEVIKIAYGLNMPSGITFHDGSLYVAEISRVLRFDNITTISNPG